ncbi:MAG: DUF2163 domain-containing protein [Pseudomonadota bacterium]
MKILPPGLQEHLDSGVTTLCWCWKLTDNSGRVLGFTDHDRTLSFDGVEFEASSGFTGSEIESSAGLAVDNLDVEGALSSAALNEDDLAAGVFDNAGVEIFRVNWQSPDQRVLMRTGNIGEVSRSANGFSAEIRGLAHRLNQPAGRLFQHTCDADLGDDRCAVDLLNAAYSSTGAVSSVQDRRRFFVTGLESYADAWFRRGRLEWQTGLNQSLAMEIKSHRLTSQGTVIELWQPMPCEIGVGDMFSVTAGCDKQFATCREKFANQANFRGFPHMPGNDFAISYPARGDSANDGASRN